MNERIRIGTRKSGLALEQTRLVGSALECAWPGLSCELVTRDTLGDRIIDRPLQSFGGKGVFVEEFENAILQGAIDLAVHSAKDMPMELKDGLTIAAVSPREDPRDVLVTRADFRPEAAGQFLIGTSSPRRQLQARLLWEELWEGLCGGREEMAEGCGAGAEQPLAGGYGAGGGQAPPLSMDILRGNVSTRLKKLSDGLYDGIILAAAGLKRLGITESDGYRFLYLAPNRFIPAGGQGIMTAEAKTGGRAEELCRAIDNEESRLCLEVERRILKHLGAGCHEPIGVYCEWKEGFLELWGIRGCKEQVRRIHLIGQADRESRENLMRDAWNGLR